MRGVLRDVLREAEDLAETTEHPGVPGGEGLERFAKALRLPRSKALRF